MDENSEPIWDTSTGVAGLLLNRENKRYYSRIQVNGKRSLKSLKTKVWSVAKLRHADTVAKSERLRTRRRRESGGDVTTGDLLDRLSALYSSPELAERTRVSHRISLAVLKDQWKACFGTDLLLLKPSKLTTDAVRRFSNFLATEAVQKVRNNGARSKRRGYGAVTTNKVIGTLHRAMRIGVETDAIYELPFDMKPVSGPSIKRPVEARELNLPPIAKMREVFAAMRDASHGLPSQAEGHEELKAYVEKRAHQSADLAEFMAYSGARIQEASSWVWEDDAGEFVVIRGTKTRTSRNRRVPKIPALKSLVKNMRERWRAEGRECVGRAFSISQCREALESACKRVGAPRLTHHSLRHYYATVCIESGVDIPTLSRWMGHADGGALAMKTYGHLRMEHSLAAAQRVTA